MNIFITLLFFIGFFALMAIGLIISRKALKKGCGLSPEDCACQKEGKDPAECDKPPQT